MSIQRDWQVGFDFLPGTPVVVEPSAGTMSSDGGLLPIRQFDAAIRMSETLAAALEDPRRPDRVEHSLLEMLRARLHGIVAGYDDQNDHAVLRHDPVFLLVAGRRPDADPLASQPTLSRFENNVTVQDLFRLRDATIDLFLDSFQEPPRTLTFDFDAVDDPCHGQQQLALFHGFYDQWQYLPLLVSNLETGQFVTLALRPGNMHASTGADDDLALLAARVRARFPGCEIHVRGDCGFGLPAMYDACDRLGVWYTFGISGNAALHKRSAELQAEADAAFAATKEPQRRFRAFAYRARSWRTARTTIVKAERTALGANRRYVVTNRPGAAHVPEAAYDGYAARGEAENRNKEIKTDLGMDRLSDHRFMANFFRLYLHGAAHNLLARLRGWAALPTEPPAADVGPAAAAGVPLEALPEGEKRKALRRRRMLDPWGRSQPCTWRTRLVKVAVEVVSSARRVLVRVAANWPHLGLYRQLSRRLAGAGPPS